MFYVIDKSKIYSYLIALCTVVILFFAAANINEVATPKNVVETSTNVINLKSVNEFNSINKNEIQGNIINKIYNEAIAEE